MRVTVTSLDDAIFTLEVSEDLEVENFKAFCEVESGLPATEIALAYNGLPMTDGSKSLKDYGVKDGEVIILQHHRPGPSQNPGQPGAAAGFGFAAPHASASFPQLDFSAIQVPSGSRPTNTGKSQKPNQDDPAFIRDVLLNDPEQLAIVKQNNPALAEALLGGDFEKFSKMIREMQQTRKDRDAQRMRLLSANPFDEEAQKLIAEEIRQKNIEANMEAAMEYNPESFGTVVMLYIDCKVNGHPIKAFVDSGAQTTIMSTDCAKKCNIMRLVDTRFSGIAKGVGTQRILGRIHMCQIQIGDTFLTSSFSILEDQKMDMLLGLDMLKRHQCTIDLRRNVLCIGTTGTETQFLHESELPESARLSWTKSEGTLENEGALDALGGEDAGLARAIEESVKEQAKNASGSSQSSNNSQTLKPDEEAKVKRLVLMGFPRDQVVTELKSKNWNETEATASLFAKSLKF